MITDEQIKHRPDCQAPGCPNKNWGMVYIGNKLYCGNCAVKITNGLAKRETQLVEDILRSQNDK